MYIKAKLRNGSEYILMLETAESDPARVFTELAAGRSQVLRGWVRVQSSGGGATQTVVLGDEIVELHLVDDPM